MFNRAGYPDHVRNYAFLEAPTQQGSKLRILTVPDKFTRASL